MGILEIIFMVCATVIILPATEGHGPNQLLCMPVENACAEQPNELAQGRPGKRGRQGLKGECGEPGIRGEKGSLGVVDYERVNAEIEAGDDALRLRVQALETVVRKMQTNLDTVQEDAYTAYKWCKFRYGGKCYRALVHSSYDVSRQQALNFCNEWGMEPADIEGPEQYNAVREYLATEIPSGGTSAEVFIGMSYNPSTDVLKFNNGTVASFVKWCKPGGYPKTASSRVLMALMAQGDPSTTWQGMYNVAETATPHGILCQK